MALAAAWNSAQPCVSQFVLGEVLTENWSSAPSDHPCAARTAAASSCTVAGVPRRARFCPSQHAKTVPAAIELRAESSCARSEI